MTALGISCHAFTPQRVRAVLQVLGHEALQHRKVERIEEVRRLREQILADLERANHAHDAAQARCDSLKQRLNAAKQELEEHEHTFDQKKQRLDAASAELESHRIKIGEFLPVQVRRVSFLPQTLLFFCSRRRSNACTHRWECTREGTRCGGEDDET
jgi:septal ring factor EnvC (AmiA/AmiB activator)